MTAKPGEALSSKMSAPAGATQELRDAAVRLGSTGLCRLLTAAVSWQLGRVREAELELLRVERFGEHRPTRDLAPGEVAEQAKQSLFELQDGLAFLRAARESAVAGEAERWADTVVNRASPRGDGASGEE